MNLKKYLSIAGGVLATAQSEANIIYTDVYPDKVLSKNNDVFDIDFDNNGSADFRAKVDIRNQWGRYVRGFNVAAEFINEIAGFDVSSNFFDGYATAISQNYYISNGALDFYNMDAVLGFFYARSTFSSIGGVWPGTGDKYAGVKLNISGNTHYGWIRLELDEDCRNLVVKDFAYNDESDQLIFAGQMPNISTAAKGIVAIDISNFNNGKDLQVSFIKAEEENGIKAYRAIVVKKDKAENFSFGEANSSFYYKEVKPNGEDQTFTFSENSKDSDGDIITVNQEYKVFILTIPDYVNLKGTNISGPSNTVTLSPYLSIDKEFEKPKIVVSAGTLSVLNLKEKSHIEIITLDGKSVFNNTISEDNKIDLKHLNSGIYVVKLKDSKTEFIQKIVL